MKITLFLCCFALCLMFSQLSHAQWVQTNGPYGGTITCFAVSGINLYAGTYAGVFLSTNNGLNWNQTSLGHNNVITALMANGKYIYAARGGHSIYRSADTGITWALLYSRPIYSPISALVTAGKNIFASTGGGILISTDSGVTWSNKSVANLNVYSIAVNDSIIFAGTSKGVLLSTDNGTTWIQTGFSKATVYAIALKDSNIFVGTGNGVLRSTDNGVSWKKVGVTTSNNYDLLVTALAISDRNIFAGTERNGVFLSTDNGTIWSKINTGLFNKHIFALLLNGNNIFAGTYCGVFVSDDKGTTWSEVNQGLKATQVYASIVIGHNILAGTIDNGIFVSTDNGLIWKRTNLTNASITDITVNDTNIYAATFDYGIFQSTDKGITWEQNVGLLNGTSLITVVSKDTITFAGLFLKPEFTSTVCRKNNSSKDWRTTNFTNANIDNLAVSGSDLLVAARDSIFISTDNGDTWADISIDLVIGSNNSNSALEVNGVNIFAAYFGGIYRSINKGKKWQKIGLDIPPVSSFAFTGSNIFAGTTPAGIYLSTDNGTTWAPFNTGLTGLGNTTVRTLVIHDGYIFAGTDIGGVWRRPLSELPTSAEESIILSEKVMLQQSYPNPATADTKITFSLPAAGFATLKVFNALGQEVTTLLAEDLSAGTHAATWDVSTAQSGTYFCRLQCGAITETMKLTVLR